MGAALVLLLVGLGAMAAGVLIGRYYVPDDRQLRRSARHSRAYMRALSHFIARDHDTAVAELRAVVEENIDDVEPYFALGAMFRSRGEHERAIRVHQALALRERERRKLRQRAMYELGLDFRAAGMPRRATRAMEDVVLEEPGHEGALRVLAALYEEQARFNEAAEAWQRLGRRRGEDTTHREHHLLVAAAQSALGRNDPDSAKQLLKAAQKLHESPHLFAAAAELASARDNHAGAKERLKQALIADPALAPHLLPGLIAAEQGLAARDASSNVTDDLADDSHADAPAPPPLPAAAPLALPSTTGAPAAAESSSLPTSVAISPQRSDHVTMSEISVLPTSVAISPKLPRDDASAPSATVLRSVLAVLGEIEAATGPRLEIALIRAQLLPPTDAAGRAELARELAARFPDALAARVAAARLALGLEDLGAVRAALATLVSDEGALAWALRGRWQCSQCGNRPGAFSWRCGQCRRWGSLRMETGSEPAPAAPRERRASSRVARPDGLLGATPDEALPAPTLDPGLSDAELASAGARRSLLGRVGGWFSGVLGRRAS